MDPRRPALPGAPEAEVRITLDEDGRVVAVDPDDGAWLARFLPGPGGRRLWEAFADAPGLQHVARALRAASEEERASAVFADLADVAAQVVAHPLPRGTLVVVGPSASPERALLELHARVRQQEAVARLGQRALAGIAVEELLPLAVESVRSTLALPDVGIGEVVGDDLVALVPGPAWRRGERVPLTVLAGGPVQEALETGRPVHTRDYDAPGTRQHPESVRRGVRSGAVVPLGAQSEHWGVLTATSPRAGAIGAQELLFLEQVALILSTAHERAAAEERTRYTSLHDALTDLPNRVLFRDLLDEALEGRDTTCALLICDLDGFKHVNDALGHAVGDSVLRQVGRRLATTADPATHLARLGGDEFALFCCGGSALPDALTTAARIEHAFSRPFLVDELEIPLGISTGIAVTPLHGQDASTLMRHADVAMYRAKTARLGHTIYDAAQDDAQLLRLAEIAALRTAITGGRFQLHYQPVVDPRTGAPSHVEALVRWIHPVRGTVPPGEFIGLAEESRLIAPLTLWVINEAVRQRRVWSSTGRRVGRTAINLSPHCITDARNREVIWNRLVQHRDSLTVEVTESALADAPARDYLRELASAGVACSVDDFGTGYASLSHLRELPVAQLKLDKTFVMHLASEPRDRAIVRTVVELARVLGMSVIAEGVETPAVAAQVSGLGVDLAQGFLWARPLPGDALADWWDEQTRTDRAEDPPG